MTTLSIARLATALAALALVSVAGTTSAGAAGGFAAGAAGASGATINCQIPNNVVCTISSSKGISSVKITANTPQGQVFLVNKTYPGCPKQVKVSWDSAYHSSGTQIVECSTGKLLFKN